MSRGPPWRAGPSHDPARRRTAVEPAGRSIRAPRAPRRRAWLVNGTVAGEQVALCLGASELVYRFTNEYDGADERGFAWDAPAVAVPWPVTPSPPDARPILSQRDVSTPPLAELLRDLRR